MQVQILGLSPSGLRGGVEEGNGGGCWRGALRKREGA